MSSTAFQKAAVLLVGGGVFTSTVYLTYHWQRMEQAYERLKRDKSDPHFSFVDNPCRNEQYQTVAPCYDDVIGVDELYLGINLLRRMLLHFNARGTVLEVGAGTGRNLPYYPATKVQRVVLVDSSDQMLSQAKQKIEASKQLRNSPPRPQFAVLQTDSAQLQLPSNSFDTVVDTFGLCSYNDPVRVVREMARVCKPSGTILLLEHGRSHSCAMVTRHLDKHAEQHAANWGCVWNRDLDAILAASSDVLEVETMRKFHFGTTYYVVARPKQDDTRAS